MFRPSWEHARVEASQGCYVTDFAQWQEFRGAVLILDTTMLAPGVFALRPVPKPYSSGVWQVPTEDSVLLAWAEVHSIARFRFQRLADSLVGTADRPKTRTSRVVARRIGERRSRARRRRCDRPTVAEGVTVGVRGAATG